MATDITKLFNQAKVQLMQKDDSTFFATLLFSMKFEWDDTQPTAYVDGVKLGFNPDFFIKLDKEERVGVLTHEACHLAYMHLDRIQERVLWIWQEACDHVVNLMLEARGFKLPSFRLADMRFTGMSTEEVYNILLAEAGPDTEPRPNPMADLRESQVNPEELKKMVDDILINAAIFSKMSSDKPGAIPGDIQRYLDRLQQPKLPWHVILRKYFSAKAKKGYTYAKPNRRYFPQFYLPANQSESMMSFEAWIDTSGSVSEADFNRFISEIAGIVKALKPEKITLGQFDHAIKSIDVVKNLKELTNVKFTGFGGTNIVPILDRAEELKPKFTLIFTDGEFHMDRDTCSADIIWMIHNNPNWTAPFGKVIHYECNNS